MSDVTLGQLIAPGQVRDAIHIAIAPVIAAEPLAPGDHVGFVVDDQDSVARTKDPIGIVDPFLKSRVMTGERCWLFLYPNTVTGMRHHWQHPAFDGKASAAPVATKVVADSPNNESIRWVTNLAKKFGMTYEGIMGAADGYLRDYSYVTQSGGQDWQDTFYDHQSEFWDHFEKITGRQPSDRGNFFSCSC